MITFQTVLWQQSFCTLSKPSVRLGGSPESNVCAHMHAAQSSTYSRVCKVEALTAAVMYVGMCCMHYKGMYNLHCVIKTFFRNGSRRSTADMKAELTVWLPHCNPLTQRYKCTLTWAPFHLVLDCHHLYQYTTVPHPQTCKHTLTNSQKCSIKLLTLNDKNTYIFYIFIPSTAVSWQMCGYCVFQDCISAQFLVQFVNSMTSSSSYAIRLTTHKHTLTHQPLRQVLILVNEKVNINCRSLNGHELQFPVWRSDEVCALPSHQPPYAYFPPCYIKGTLLTALTLNLGIGRQPWCAESSNMEVIPGDTLLHTHILTNRFWMLP